MRLYNEKNGQEYTTVSDDPLHVQVYLDAGWQPAPEMEQRPGFQPEPVVYAPVKSEPEEPEPAKGKAKASAAKSTASKADSE
jgi:hypothetical protein